MDANDREFSKTFPYVALPNSGSGPASAGFGTASQSGTTSASPAATPTASASGGTKSPGTGIDSSPAGSDSGGVSTGLLIGAAVLALLIGLGLGSLVGRRRT